MKLAEALQERADLNRRIEQIRGRLLENSFTQKGTKPAASPDGLLGELDQAVARLERLIAAINHANSTTTIEGRTLTEIIAEKDCLAQKVSILRDVIQSASGAITRHTRSEIMIVRTVDVPALQHEADVLAKRIRLLDNELQATNWSTEIIVDP